MQNRQEKLRYIWSKKANTKRPKENDRPKETKKHHEKKRKIDEENKPRDLTIVPVPKGYSNSPQVHELKSRSFHITTN